MTNPEFIVGLERGINYAHEKVTAAGSDLTQLDPLKENFYQLIKMGLQFEETWRPATELALALFKYVEARRYGRDLKPLLQSAASHCEVGDEQLNGRLLNRLGSLCRIERRYDEALQLLNEGLKLAKSVNDLHLIGQIHWNIAVVIYESDAGALADAKEHALKAVEVLTMVGSPKRGQALNRLGLIVRDLGEHEPAIKYFHESIAILKEAKDWIDVIRVMNSLGESHRRRKEYNKAIQVYKESLLLGEKLGDSTGLTNTLIDLGAVYANQKLYKLAEITFSRIDTGSLIQCGDLVPLAHVYNNLGYVKTHLGQLDVAETLLKESLTIHQSLGNGILIAATLDSLATLYRQTSRTEGAIEFYSKALKYLEQYPQNEYAQSLWQRYNKRLETLVKQ